MLIINTLTVLNLSVILKSAVMLSVTVLSVFLKSAILGNVMTPFETLVVKKRDLN